LRYDLIDEGAYEPEQLAAIGSPLSGVFGIETASDHRALQAAAEKTRVKTACNLIKLCVLSDAQIAQVTGLSVEQVRALREADQH
jgi:hypothetical protein